MWADMRVLNSMFDWFGFGKSSAARISCFHCGETARESQMLYVPFNGQQQPVCCRGCLTILKTVEKNHLTDAYLAERLASSGK